MSSFFCLLWRGFPLVFPTGKASEIGISESATPDRPKWKFLRFQEDWSVMRNIPESERTDPFDAIKYIPLTEDGNFWVSFGGRARTRLENWSNFAFAEPNDDTFLLTRLFLHSDIHLGKPIRIFLEGKNANVWGRELPGGARTLDVDELELQQAFFDVRVPIGDMGVLTFRGGRRELLKGKQRLVSPLPWGNTLRHWDGVSGILDVERLEHRRVLDAVRTSAKILLQRPG